MNVTNARRRLECVEQQALIVWVDNSSNRNGYRFGAMESDRGPFGVGEVYVTP